MLYCFNFTVVSPFQRENSIKITAFTFQVVMPHIPSINDKVSQKTDLVFSGSYFFHYRH